MKILPKGLILVGIPLIYGIIFIASLFWGISQANRLVLSEHVAEDSIVSFVAAARYSVFAVRYQAVYAATQRKQWHERAKFNEKLTAKAYAHLDALRESDPSLPIPSSTAGRSKSIPFSPGPKFAAHIAELGKVFLGEHQILLGDLPDLTHPLQAVCDVRTEDASSATRSLRVMLYGGISAEFVISIALIAYFFVSIINRVKKILNNTINLSKGLELSDPLKGTDEIAELDRFLFQAATKVRELERFKKEMVEVVGEELKNPLNQVETFFLSLRDGAYGISNPKSIDKVTAGCTSVQRLIALIGDHFHLDRSEVTTAGPSSSTAPDSNKESEPKPIKIPAMKFSVLKQGLLIISVPLLFQLVFVVMLARTLENINKRNDFERMSNKFLMAVNQSSTELVEATRFGIVYMFTKVPVYRQMFQDGLTKAIAEIDKAKEQVNDQHDQINDLQLCRDAMARFPSRLAQETSRLAVVYAHNPSGSFANMQEFMDLFKDPEHPSESLLKRVQALIDDKVHVLAYQPFFDAQDAMERLISRENSAAEELATQRDRLLSTLNLTLLAGLGLASMLSILLANFLMRNLISRVQHVMENTGRIIKHETLEPPGAGADEITYLDQFLCETGNRLFALEQFKNSLIAIVSQEIRTDLTSVCNALELLSEGALGELSPDEAERLKVAKEEARGVVRLINDLLDLEKMAAGKFVLEKTEVPVSELVEQTSMAVTPLAVLRKIRLELDRSRDDVDLQADRDRLIRALVNLISSRVKCSPQQSAVMFLTACKAFEVEFRVIDHDGGIPEELREKIFDRFVQLENPEARDLIGPGLTLAITKAIVEQHGGTIGVDSEMGKGTTFWIKLPIGA